MFVILLDGLELVAQVLLDDVFHVPGQVRQPLLDVRGLGPDAAGDQGLVKVGQVHEGGEVLAQANRIDDGEPHLPGRKGGQVAQHECLQRLHGQCPAWFARPEQHRTPPWEGQERRQRELRRHLRPEPVMAWQAVGQVRQVDLIIAEMNHRRHAAGRLPVLPGGAAPGGKERVALAIDLADGGVHLGQALLPAVDQRLPFLFMTLLAFGHLLEVLLVDAARIRLVALKDLRADFLKALVRLAQVGVAAQRAVGEGFLIFVLALLPLRIAPLLEAGLFFLVFLRGGADFLLA